MKSEIRALREREEAERKQREAEEKRKREAEELAKRHKELAAAPPPLPAVREEEDDVFVVEFGETELHRQAANKGNSQWEKFSLEIKTKMFYFRCRSFEITSR